MRKFLLVIATAVFLISGVGAVVTAKQAYDKGFIPDHLEEFILDEVIEYAPNLKISGDYAFTINQGNDDSFHITGEGLKNKAHEFTIEIIDETLVFEVKSSKKWYEQMEIMNIDFYNKRISPIIEVPVNFNGNLEVKSSSGSIKVNDLNVKNLNLNCSSGSIRVNNTKSINTTINASSGSVTLTNVSALDMNIKVSSGSINLVNEASLLVNKMNARVSSGSINLEGEINEITCHSSSGSTTLKLNSIPDKLTATGSSGSINIYLDGSYMIYAKVSSGSIKVKPGSQASITTNKEYHLYAKTSSGNINLYPR